jgi:tetratricopeptide (TPR) repeat protein
VADFDPRQLDALEDALEDLEIDDDLAGLDLAPELLERLAEYQHVLALTRDAYPLDDPPEGLLDGVIAEAREVARNAPTITPTVRGTWRQAWDRWRSGVVPVAALAGAAALVLIIAKPGDDQKLAVVDPPKLELKEDAPGDPASGQTLERDSAEAARSATKPEEPEPEPDSEAIELLDESDSANSIPEPKPTAKKKATAGGAGAMPPTPAVDPSPVTPLSKDDAWSDLERADSARRKGDCDRARSIYDKVIAAASQSDAIARAKAGIGLCLEQDGKSSQADTWFDQARESSKAIDAWIRSQRDDQPLPGEKKKSKSNDAFEALDSL